jgi:hypothetical protein
MTDPTNQASGYPRCQGASGDAGFCPSAEQPGAEVSAWLRDHGSPGEAVVVLFRHQGLCQFRLDEIAAWRGHRVQLVEHGSFDAQGLAVGSPKSIYLRILKPSAAVLAAALTGATMQHCTLVNRRDLSAREEALAQRLRDKFGPET